MFCLLKVLQDHLLQYLSCRVSESNESTRVKVGQGIPVRDQEEVMKMFKKYRVRSYEVGLLFRNGEFRGLLDIGTHRFFDALDSVRVDVVSQRDPWLTHEKLDLIVKSGALEQRAVVLDLQDHERALVWINNRFSHILPAGQYAYWSGQKDVRIEILDARVTRFEHEELTGIARSPLAQMVLDVVSIKREHVGVLFVDGRFVDTLLPGFYAFWKAPSDAVVVEVDLRETTLDVGGQDIMTADKVTLRVNAVVTWKIENAHKAVTQTDDVRQALYRDTQLVLRATIGARELDDFLTDKDAVSQEIEQNIRGRASQLGLEIASVGIRDVILPGDMKDLMNKVTEAKKAAEANLISRREETAAMRSQANTARLLADNPALMRLRELEALEKVAACGQLNVILGNTTENGGLTDKVVNLL